MFKRILIVCTGNICRSPIAEALLIQALAGRGIEVHSAGTSALVGEPADALAVEVAAAHGVDLTAHRAQQVTRDLLTHSDLILTMDAGHNQWIARHCPELRGRVHKLGRWLHNADVADPYGNPRSAFVETFESIAEYLPFWVPRITG